MIAFSVSGSSSSTGNLANWHNRCIGFMRETYHVLPIGHYNEEDET